MPSACSVRVRGVVQGVGFRPFVFRLARANTLAGWVLNVDDGVEIHLEGADDGLHAFLRELRAQPPRAATIAMMDVVPASLTGVQEFTIRESERRDAPTTRICPDLAVCENCLTELFDPGDPRHGYSYINCTDCGPRFSIIQGLPYDRATTTMAPWAMDGLCEGEFHDPASRRFHAQPVACPACGPHYILRQGDDITRNHDAVRRAAEILRDGGIVAVKGIGGYHLACDATNSATVTALRERKFRREKPFALMVRDTAAAREMVHLTTGALALLESSARPIVLAPSRIHFPGVAPDSDELGVMLAYTPMHHLLFAAGAPDVLVMTSANRSSEPIAFEDDDALERLNGVADAFLIGERPIARRVDDSVARDGAFGPVILRRGRGYAPGAVAEIPTRRPLLGVGADLKNAVTLVVGGQAFVSQHIGDLSDARALQAFRETIRDLLSMYEVPSDQLSVIRDCHPEYSSTVHALGLESARCHAVQHHRAHVASVLAERGAWERRVLGVCFDGTGFGDDGSIWGGEFFAGSVVAGFERVAHLRQAALIGGDAAARHPVQAASGFLAQLDSLPDLTAAPFLLGDRYSASTRVFHSGTRVFATTSMGRLFDAAAALLGFTRPMTFEGQAAIWVEQLARGAAPVAPYPFPFAAGELDFRSLLAAVVRDRHAGRDVGEIARAFQGGVASGVHDAIVELCEAHTLHTVALSGGVFQNELLLADLKNALVGSAVEVWTNRAVPPNDGGVSLGQVALAAFEQFDGK